LLGLGLGLEAKFSGLGLETSGLGLEAFGLVFLALALFKAKVKVTNILPNTMYLGIISNYTNSVRLILKESSINIGICKTFLFSLHHEYLM